MLNNIVRFFTYIFTIIIVSWFLMVILVATYGEIWEDKNGLNEWLIFVTILSTYFIFNLVIRAIRKSIKKY